MKRVLYQPLLTFCKKCFEENGRGEGRKIKNEGVVGRDRREDDDDIDDLSEQFKRMTLHLREPSKRGEELSPEDYGKWRQEQRWRVGRLKKQHKAKWAPEELIDTQLGRFRTHYCEAAERVRMKDVTQMLLPMWAPAQEMVVLSWLGDWKPSAILELLRSLVQSSTTLSEPKAIDRSLSQLIHDIRIEEAVLDEEMAEIQATCILQLPVDRTKIRPSGLPLSCIRSEFRKIHGVVTKAQNLRLKALELVVNKVLTQTDAAEFFVAFAGIEESIHEFVVQQKLRKGPVSVPVKA